MKTIKESDIRSLASSFLFENQLNERYRPDDFTNSRTTMYDRPANIDKDGNVNQIEMPLVADDYVTNTAYIRRNHKIRDDENFKPNNSIELSNSIVCLIDDYKDDIDSYEGETDGNDIFDDIYTSVKTILKKV